MSLRLLISETTAQLLVFFRSAVAAFFTLLLPLMFLVLLDVFIGEEGGNRLVPSIAVFGVLTATLTNLAITTAMARDSNVLKRVAGSPMPMSIHLGGRVVAAVVIALVSVVLMLAIGAFLLGIDIPWGNLGVFGLIVLGGASAFSAVGLSIAALARSARAAPAIANFIVLPLAFVSGVFFPVDQGPAWMATIARLLPLEPIATEAVAAFTGEPANVTRALVSAAVWTLIGSAVAFRFFSFEPTPGGQSRSRSVVPD